MKRCLSFLLQLLFWASIIANSLSPKVSAANELPQIKIAGQFGLVYASLMTAEKLRLFEKYGLKPVWKEYGSGAAVREALVSGEVDAGFMEIPPFLIGWDKGCPWKVAMGFVVVPMGLVTNNPQIKSLKDLKPADQIAVPSPGSIHDILISMAAEKELGSPTAPASHLVAMSHPDDDLKAFGQPFCFNVGVASQKFHDNQPERY